MKTATATLLLLLTTAATAQANYGDWETSFRKCDIGKSFAKEETIIAEDGSRIFVTITPADIPALEAGIAVLKQCRKFWDCVAQREQGKVKHCYMPKEKYEHD